MRAEDDTTPDKKRIGVAMKDAVERFLSLDVRQVQDACNARRDDVQRVLARYRDDDLVAALPGLENTTAKRARQEIARPFALVPAPQPIVITFRHDSHPDAPNAAAFVRPHDPQYTGLIFALADNIDAARLCVRDTRAPLLDVVFHEMLHLSGDAATKLEDGVARHQYAGTEVIRGLLGMPTLLPRPA